MREKLQDLGLGSVLLRPGLGGRPTPVGDSMICEHCSALAGEKHKAWCPNRKPRR